MASPLKTKVAIAEALVFVLGLVVLVLVAPALAQRSVWTLDWTGLMASATVRITPPVSDADVGDIFDVEVWIDNAEDLGSFEFKMSYDPGIVHVQTAQLGPLLGSTGRTPVPLGPNIDNVAGIMQLGAFSFGSQPGANGSGIIAVVTLEAVGNGTSALHLYDVQVTDTLGQVQDVTTDDGSVVVGAAVTETPTLTPTSTDTPTLTWTPTRTPTLPSTATPTKTPTRTPTPTGTPSPTWMPTRTATPTPTVTSTPGVKPTQTPALSTIEGYAWEDLDGDGWRDQGETGIPGQKASLDAPFAWALGVRQHFTMTDAQGHYQFKNVSPGGHLVRIRVPMNHWPTTSSSVKVLTTVHETVFVDFGLYRLLPVSYLPLVQRGKK
jgi:hypothetical protein